MTPANGRVALAALEGQVEAQSFVNGRPARIRTPLADLRTAPSGKRGRQLLYGAAVVLLEERDGCAFVQAQADGYVGYLEVECLGAPLAPTHRVGVRASHLYSEADIKAPERHALSLGSLLHVEATRDAFSRTEAGFVPSAHLVPLDAPEPDPVAVAERLIGTPYLWGGNSASGIDCSGLVQIAAWACGADCPGDSDLQEAAFHDRRASGQPRRGDLLFWKGHVAWVADPGTILHANAHHMAVAYEDLAAARARIEAQGEGAVTSHVRPFPEIAT